MSESTDNTAQPLDVDAPKRPVWDVIADLRNLARSGGMNVSLLREAADRMDSVVEDRTALFNDGIRSATRVRELERDLAAARREAEQAQAAQFRRALEKIAQEIVGCRTEDVYPDEEISVKWSRLRDLLATPTAAPEATCSCKWSLVQGRIWCDSCAAARDAVLAAAAAPKTDEPKRCPSEHNTESCVWVRCVREELHPMPHYSRDREHEWTEDADDLDAHLAEQMADPVFAAAYRARQAVGASAAYFCPTSGEVESPTHGGFDVCCDVPELHRAAVPGDGKQDATCGHAFIGNVGEFTCDLYAPHDGKRHWNSLAEFGWGDEVTA